MLLKNYLKDYEKKFKDKGIENALFEITYIIRETLQLKENNNLLLENIFITDEQRRNLDKLFKKRLARVPLQRIFKKVYFRDVKLKINNHNFIPRIDTESIFEVFQEIKLNPRNILELGTGSGAIIIALLKTFSKAKGLATDISYEAIYMAKKNAILNNVNNRVNFICCNWLDVFANINYDVIVSNPPYIKTRVIKSLEPEVKDHEPFMALDGGFDGLEAYRMILSNINKISKKSMFVLFEMGHDQAKSLGKIMKINGLNNIKVFNDYNQKSRFIIGLKE